jgi:hypothetical protein
LLIRVVEALDSLGKDLGAFLKSVDVVDTQKTESDVLLGKVLFSY